MSLYSMTDCSPCVTWTNWHFSLFLSTEENSIDTSQLCPSLALCRHEYDTINESLDSIVVALRLLCSTESKLLKWRRSSFLSLCVHHKQTLHTHLLISFLTLFMKIYPEDSFRIDILHIGFTVIWQTLIDGRKEPLSVWVLPRYAKLLIHTC